MGPPISRSLIEPMPSVSTHTAGFAGRGSFLTPGLIRRVGMSRWLIREHEARDMLGLRLRAKALFFDADRSAFGPARRLLP
jgi:hypothetical protein